MPRKPRRATFHHGDTRRAAVEAALVLVTQDGREALTLRTVAERIGVNHRALYRHFASLEALKVEVAALGFGRLADVLEKVPPGQPRALARAYATFAFAEPSLYDLMFSLPLRQWYGDDTALGPAMRRVTAAAVVAIGTADAQASVFRLWGLAHGLIGLYRAGAWRARSDRQAIRFIAGLV
ncbi:MAG: TetR/AcrR family transcriptional regulator [Reyranella sp.]|nr:TetR/AcrR family transcriptional regulator [Reyranella sp.]MDP2331619.1 TetR/AcrR family transcriptional regulator [Reyranella sp.]